MFTSLNASLKTRQAIYNALAPKAPPAVAERFSQISPRDYDELEDYLTQHYFTRTISNDLTVVNEYLSGNDGKMDMYNHLHARLDGFRQTIVPWLNDAMSLDGANILEIGCGTGSSTVALAEQGAHVVGVDIDDASLKVARKRSSIYDVNADFHIANATEVHEKFSDRKFDFIIYFACLEHMTHNERLSSMRSTWNMLDSGGLWCVIETPNRIWYDDHHTAHMPFFMWLPDDLAFKYSKYSPRKKFNSSFDEYSEASFLKFLRAGRGVSYHEFELAMGDPERLDIVSSLSTYSNKRGKLWALGRSLTRSRNSQYESFLRKVCPRLHKGFLDAALDLIIRK